MIFFFFFYSEVLALAFFPKMYSLVVYRFKDNSIFVAVICKEKILLIIFMTEINTL